MNWTQLINTQNLEGLAFNLIRSGMILSVGFIVQLIANYIIRLITTKALAHDDDDSTAFEQKAKTLIKLIRNSINIVVFVVVMLMLLSEWGLDIRPILAGAGILGLAVGFGTQTLVRDIVTGFFILFENQFNVGDNIRTAGMEGMVEEIRLRTTVLKGENGTIHIIPNSQINAVTKLPKHAKAN